MEKLRRTLKKIYKKFISRSVVLRFPAESPSQLEMHKKIREQKVVNRINASRSVIKNKTLIAFKSTFRHRLSRPLVPQSVIVFEDY